MRIGYIIVFVILLISPLQAEEWKSYQSEHFIFYYKGDHLTEGEITGIAEAQEEIFAIITDLLNLEFRGRITYYLHTSREEFGSTAAAYCSGTTIHILCNICQDKCKDGLHDGHELTHALCYQLNPSQRSLLAEGLAVYVDNHVLKGENLHSVMKVLHEQNKLPALRSVYIDFWGCPSNYFVAGSFVTFLIEEYGMQKFKTLYIWSMMGGDFQAVYKKSLDVLEHEWIETITRAEVTPEGEYWAEVLLRTEEGTAAFYAVGLDPGEYGTYPSNADEGVCMHRELFETNPQAAFQYLELYNTAMIAWKDAIETFKRALQIQEIEEKTELFEKATSLYEIAGDWEMAGKSRKYMDAYQLLMETHSSIEQGHVETAEANLKRAEEILDELGETEEIHIYYVEIQQLRQQVNRMRIGIVFMIMLGVGAIVLWMRKKEFMSMN